MGKTMGHKKLIIALAVSAALLVGVVACVMAFGNRKQSYRSIKIVEMEGKVAIDREGMASLDASVNMNLVSGDYVTTQQDSYVVLRLDADKYVMLGEGGAMKVIAEGDENSGRTSIELASGSVLNEIQNPLGQNATFDIVTPNATMSVRGTVFEVRKNADGTMGVLVYDGKVAVGLDGKEPVLYQAGEYTEFTGGDAPEFLTEKGTITEAQMSEEVLERLQKIQEQGRDLNLDVLRTSSDANTLQASAKNESEQSKAQEEASRKEEIAQQKEQEEVTQQKEQEATQPKEEIAQQKEQESVQKQKEEAAQKKETAQKQESVTKPQETVQTPISEQTQAPAEEPDIDVDDDDDDEDSEVNPVQPTPVEPEKPTPVEPEKPAPAEPEKPTPAEPEKPTPAEPEKPTPVEPEKPTPEEPEKPTPEEPEKPEPEQGKVIYLLPCIVLSSEGEDGERYTDLKDVEPVVYMEKTVEEADRPWLPISVEETADYRGDIGGATHYQIIGWCTEDGTEWNFSKDALQEDVAIYPIWHNNGKFYYPVIYEDPDTGKTYCNSIEKGSLPRVNGTVIGQ
ncbi:MAG: FecR domain-containing protein [Bacteroidales bacterium]|nr:FecR domain-containing protein [Lachnoclostridium sp.]MCM1384577.1 FecR domain-containing protein [Lachnoclostridium sp.]MCM1465141.1 FecR domain-containing protein [Bacteroidales bacterium]